VDEVERAGALADGWSRKTPSPETEARGEWDVEVLEEGPGRASCEGRTREILRGDSTVRFDLSPRARRRGLLDRELRRAGRARCDEVALDLDCLPCSSSVSSAAARLARPPWLAVAPEVPPMRDEPRVDVDDGLGAVEPEPVSCA